MIMKTEHLIARAWTRWILCAASLLVALSLPHTLSAQGTNTYNYTGSAQTFTVPAGVSQITIKAWGAGGGGGGSNNSAYGGGGGGAFAMDSVFVTEGQQFTLNIGQGGVGGTGATGAAAGQNGGFSNVIRVSDSVELVKAAGGAQGGTTGGAGGTVGASVGATKYAGGSGASAAAGGGGGGSATETATGGSTSSATGGTGEGTGGAGGGQNNGAVPGGGGGGKPTGNNLSGNGGHGRVVISWAAPVAPSVAGVPASQDYNEGTSGNLLLAPLGTLTDTDSGNLNGGYLRAEVITNEESSEDRLWISEINSITIENHFANSNGVLTGTATVKHAGTTIGTITAANSGYNGAPLQIDFNASATPARAQDLLRSLYYRNTDAINAVASARSIRLTVNDATQSVDAATAITVINEPFGITYPSSAWTPILAASKYDPSEDQQATSGPDLVGTDGVPMLYGKYDDMGTPSNFADDIVAFRARVDDSLTNTGYYSGYVFVGMDFELDGDIDVFFALEGTSKGTRVFVYETSDFCTSPSTTGIGAAFLVPNHTTATDANYTPVHTIEGTPLGTANSYPGNDGETDYFISFKFNFADLKTVLDPRPLNQAVDNGGAYAAIGDLEVEALQVGMSVITPYRFILATATQNNALNSDFGGVGRLSRTDRNQSWEDLGLFDDDDGGVTFGNAAPVFTSGSGATASYTVPENTTPVATVTANDPDGDDAVFNIRTGPGYGVDGALFQINPFTGELSFVTAPNYEVPSDADANNEYLVTVEVSDGKGGITTQLVRVYVTDEPEGSNAVPAITSNGAGPTATLSFAENGTGTVTTVTTADAGDLSGLMVVAATQTYSISGGADAGSFSIVPGTGVLTFVSAPDFETQSSYTVHVTVTDANGATDTQILTINITNVSEAPVLTADTPTLATITEDETNNAGMTVKSLLNLNVIDTDFGPLATDADDDVGIAITGMSSGNGTWEYSTDGGLNWAPFNTEIVITLDEDPPGTVIQIYSNVDAGPLSAGNALLLRPEDYVRFKPNGENGTTASFNFLAWDQSSGGPGSHVDASVTGGTTAFSTVSDTADITVTDVNDAPTVAGGPLDLAAQMDYDSAPAATAVSDILADAALTYGDVDTGAVSGLAVTARSGAGTWQFHNGTAWADITGVNDDNARLLLPSYEIRYLPAYAGPDGGETATLTLRGWDRTTGTAGSTGDANPNGGTTAYSTGTFLLRVEIDEDDRAASVGIADVNEATPWAVFAVTGVAGQKLEFSVTNGTTSLMNSADLEYFDGSDWVSYTPGDFVTVGASPLLVRVAITTFNERDLLDEGTETFTLVATTTGGVPSTGGAGSISDDGSGDVFLDDNETSTPSDPGDTGYPALDDDRVPLVNSPEVNEASDYAIFKVTGDPGQPLELELGLDADNLTPNATLAGFTLEWYDPVGDIWNAYTGGSFVNVPAGGILLVRANIVSEQDPDYEGREVLTLTASTASGTSGMGLGSIFDDGTGDIFLATNEDGDPNDPLDPGYPAELDDDSATAPVVTTLGSNSVTAYKATINGRVNPGLTSTDAWFEYSTDSTLGSGVTSTAPQALGDGATEVGFLQQLTGLIPETRYYYRAVAENSEGLTYGAIESFVSSYPFSSSEGVVGLPVGGEIYRPMPGPINPSGRITTKFFAYVNVGGVTAANDAFLMSDGSGTMTVLGREGQVVPGLGTMRAFFENLIILPNGHSLVRENFSASGRLNTAFLTTDNGLGTTGVPPMALICKTGDVLPEGGIFKILNGAPVVDDNGMLCFGNTRSGAGITAKNDTGIWCDDAGQMTCLALEGEPVPGLVDAAGVSNAWYGNIKSQVVVGGGGAAFVATFQNNPANRRERTPVAHNSAVIVCDLAHGRQPGAVVRKGFSVPGTNGKKWSNLLDVSAGTGGEIAVVGSVSGATRTTDQMLVRVGTDETQQLVLQEGVTIVPGTGLTVDRLSEKYLTANGDIAFCAFLRGAGPANDQVICHWNPVAGLRVVLREGDFLPAPLVAQRATQIGRFTVSPGGNIALSVVTDDPDVRHVVLREKVGTGVLEVVEYSGRLVWYRNQQYPILTLGMYEAYTSSNSTGGHGAGINDAGQMGLTLDLGVTRHVLKVYD